MNIEKIRNKIEEYELYEKMQIKEFIPIFEQLDNKITERIIDKEIFSFYQRKYKNPIYDNYNLKGEIERLKQEREDITRDKTELEKSKKQLENEIFGYKDDIAKLNAQINNIYQSKSWKVAKKLSKIKHVFKK